MNNKIKKGTMRYYNYKYEIWKGDAWVVIEHTNESKINRFKKANLNQKLKLIYEELLLP